MGLALGTILGLEAQSHWHDAQPLCSQGGCDDQGYRLWSDARHNAALSTIAFSIGGAAITGSVVLWLTAPPWVASMRVGGAATSDSRGVVVRAEF